MDSLTAILLGFVQGLSEFLPISSSGHLVIGQRLIGVEPAGVVLEVFLHLGTLLAVLVFYRKTVFSLIVGIVSRDAEALRYSGKLLIGTLPAVFLVLIARDAIRGAFDLPWVAGVSLIFTGCVLLSIKKTLKRATESEPSWWAAWWIGCAQAVAVLPGISRSGLTVAVALACGVRFEKAAEFSFMLSLLAISGATLVSVPEFLTAGPATQSTMILGVFSAALSGLVALGLFVRLLRRGVIYRFAYYDWVVGALFLIWLFYT